ncbi:MAG: peptidylprolyl isomerase [Bacillota bacterium]|nr:peptidylprolyl isomerase [Bacillota bacterium]
MKNLKKIVSIALISCLVAGSSGCAMIEKTQYAMDKQIVATFGKEKITRGELYKQYQMAALVSQTKAQYGENYTKDATVMTNFKQSEQQILNEIIDEKIILQKAKDLKLVPDDATLKKEMQTQKDTIKKQNNVTDAASMKTFLKQAGLPNEAALDTELKNSVIIQKVVDNQTKDITVSDSDIQAAYESSKYTKYVNFTSSSGSAPKIHTWNILTSTEDDAKKIKQRLDNGEDFATIAKATNTDSTKDTGGDLGDIEITSLVPEYVDGAIALKPNQISNPVKSSYGYHIIKLISKDDFTVKPLSEVKDDVKQTALQTAKSTKFQTVVKGWESSAKIETKSYEKNL